MHTRSHTCTCTSLYICTCINIYIFPYGCELVCTLINLGHQRPNFYYPEFFISLTLYTRQGHKPLTADRIRIAVPHAPSSVNRPGHFHEYDYISKLPELVRECGSL